MVVSYKDLQNLAGYTYLVSELDSVITDINEEKFVREKVNDDLLKNYKGGEVIILNNLYYKLVYRIRYYRVY